MPPTKQKHKPPSLASQLPAKQPNVHSQRLFDWEEWLPYLDEFEGTEAQKKEFIETLWVIIQGFVDLKWQLGSDPMAGDLQLSSSQPADSHHSGSPPLSSQLCGQNFDLSAVLMAAVVQSKVTEQTRITQQNPKEDV